MVVAPDLPHAFDAVEVTPHSRAVVRETVAFLEAALAPAAPPDDVPLPKRASAFIYAGEPGNAVAVYREILAKSPDDGEARTLLGLALSRSGKPAEAVVELERALALGADSASLQQNLGEAYLRSGNPAEAAVHYRKRSSGGGSSRPSTSTSRARRRSRETGTRPSPASPSSRRPAGEAARRSSPRPTSPRSGPIPRWAATLAKFPAPPR